MPGAGRRNRNGHSPPSYVAKAKNTLDRWLRRRNWSKEDREDLIQEAFLRLETYKRRGGDVHRTEAFLMRTVQNLARSQHRQERDRPRIFVPLEDCELVCEKPTPEQALAYEQAMNKVCDRLETEIGNDAEQIYVLHRVYGFTFAELGELVGKSPRTIEKIVARAALAITEMWLEQLAAERAQKK